MIQHTNLNNLQVFRLIRQNKNLVVGNAVLKIYGQLDCASGERMKKQNRIFFTDEAEALAFGFRPCGHCMKEKYKLWRSQQEAG